MPGDVVVGGVVVVLGVVVVELGGVLVLLGGVVPGRLLGGMSLGGRVLGVTVPVGGHGLAVVDDVVPLVPAVPVALGVVLPIPVDEVVPVLLLGLDVVPPGDVLVLPVVVLEPVLVPVPVGVHGPDVVVVLLPGVVPVWLGVVAVDWLGVVVVVWLGVVVVVCEGVVPVVLGLVCVVEGVVWVADGLPIVPAPDGAVDVEPTPLWVLDVPGAPVAVPAPELPVV